MTQRYLFGPVSRDILHCRQQPGEAPPVAGHDVFARPVTPRLDPLPAADPDAIYRAGAGGEDPGIEKPVAAPLQQRGIGGIE